MNRLQRKKLKRKTNVQLLFFTFLGAFILFFTAFTYFLPIVTPKVEIPALTEEHVLDSVTSHDFRGRVDPRLHSLEITEGYEFEREDEQEDTDSTTPKAPQAPISLKVKEPVEEVQEVQAAQETQIQEPGEKRRVAATSGPPRPRPITFKNKPVNSPPVPLYQAKVVVGDFHTPKEVRVASDILLSLDYEPFIIEEDDKFMIQVGTYNNAQKAESVLNDLRRRNFNAKIVYE